VISPLLANIYLNYFDRVFHLDKHSPLHEAGARLVRYADDLVVMARQMTKEITMWIESMLEGKLELNINREKTKVVKLGPKGDHLNFLGYTFRFDRDLRGRNHYYLNMRPSEKAIKAIKDKIHMATSNCVSITLKEAIKHINRITKGWKNYFSIGCPKEAYRDVNYYLQIRFHAFIGNRSQRRMKPFRQGESNYAGLRRLGLEYL
jgi:RNA-directed DNA polymerase